MNIKIESTNKSLSSLGGLVIYEQLFRFFAPFLPEAALPVYKIATRSGSLSKFKALVLGFVSGADCLDDMDSLATDPGFEAVNGGYVNAANTYGDFLRKFSHYQCRLLTMVLIDFSMRLRNLLFPDADFVLDIDSTEHEQFGHKMEGARYNKDGKLCLDSLKAFDQFGFQYWNDLRPGATFTANGAAEVIHRVFAKVDRKKKKLLRADSGYCNTDVFEAARTAGAGFVICMRANMYEPLLHAVKHWRRAKKIRFFDGRPCEIGHTLQYYGRQALRVVVIRALREGEQQRSLFADARYEYRAWITNLGHHEITNEDVIDFYKGRGHAENFIRELKNGFDLHHFPCQKLSANKAYSIMASIAYNMMRFIALKMNRNKPSFSKAIRFRTVFLAVQVVKHAREVSFRFHNSRRKEVDWWMTTLKLKFGFS